jgi:two-component system, response regulator PdtaR
MRPGDVEAVRAPVRRPLKPTVLVVEHEAIVRMDLATELQDHGFDVLETASADAALALFRSCPDLHAAVVDVGLRGEATGYDLVRAMRKDRPGCTVIIASGRTLGMPGDFDQPVLVEPKPYDPEKIAFVLKDRCRGG